MAAPPSVGRRPAIDDAPHRRHDPLADRWVLVSPHRTDRPWQGAEAEPEPAVPAYDPGCYLCPRNERAGGERNPDYSGVWSFPNDFSAVLPDAHGQEDDDPLFRREPAAGEARVVCFSPDHGRDLPRLSQPERRAVVDEWARLTGELGRRWEHVQLFENRGAMMGASNPHPHGQVWATAHVPDLVRTEDRTQAAHHARTGECLLDQVAARQADGERVVARADGWLAVVPYWASWPFEVLLLNLGGATRMTELGDGTRDGLADILGQVTRTYDRLFGVRFPYSMGWHGAPGLGRAPHWRLHAHFYPPLLRSASVRKFMVGYEMLAEPQRDLTPERAAALLRAAA